MLDIVYSNHLPRYYYDQYMISLMRRIDEHYGVLQLQTPLSSVIELSMFTVQTELRAGHDISVRT